MNKDTIGLIFSLLWTAAIALAWFWILFKDGAKKLGEEMIQFQKHLGTYHKSYEFMFHPMAVKITASIFLAAGVFSMYWGIRAVLK